MGLCWGFACITEGKTLVCEPTNTTYLTLANHHSVSDFFFWDRARKLSGYVVSQRVLSGWRPKFKPVFEENLPTIVNLIKRCWQNDPMDRPTMKEVHEILAAWEEDAQVTPSENTLVNRQDSEELQRKSFVTFARERS